MKQIFAKRFLQFWEKLKNCEKAAVRDTISKIISTVKTTTGKNLAELGLLLNKPADQLSPTDASKIVFSKVEDENKYRVNFINELIDVKHGKLEVADFQDSELEEIMEFLCSS